MKGIVITGATGYVGRQLVPPLQTTGVRMLLVGRDTTRLGALFPGVACATYDDWTTRAQGFDSLLHLAVLNNTHVVGTAKEFQRVNVDLAVQLAKECKSVNIQNFIFVSSVHALDTSVGGHYAESKRQAARALAGIPDLRIRILHLAYVWGQEWSGPVRFLNKLPPGLSRTLFMPLAALKPSVHVRTIADALLSTSAAVRGVEVLTDDQDRNPWYRAGVAFMNYGFALVVLLGLWWLLLILWLGVRLDSPGAGIFRQTRVGRDGREFVCYKFRTMSEGTANVATHEVSPAAVTRVGGFLRRWKLDELPQVWNILRGELSLVGPRPGLPNQTELYEARRREGVLAIKPGITGWAQIHDIDMSDPEKLVMWDRQYLKIRCLALDFRIVLFTALGRGAGDRTATQA